MCFVIAVIAVVLAVAFVLKSLYWYGFFAGVTAAVFIALMIRNIYEVKKRRSQKDSKDDS